MEVAVTPTCPSRKDLIPSGLPSGRRVVEEGIAIGRRIRPGRTLFLRQQGVASEAEYKRRMRARGEVMFHAQYGLSSWAASADGLRRMYGELTRRGARLDRFGLCLDRAMGLPPEARARAIQESGLKLAAEEEWKALGEAVPVQPHLGDHMIGSPASEANTVRALEAGVTSVGNLSQFFSYEYPGWTDAVSRAAATVRALGIMAVHRAGGAIVHSNLDDGFGALFVDRVSAIGWAILERRLVEDLVGAALTHSFGNLVADPATRVAFLWALDGVHGGETAGSMVVANTLFTPDRDRNVAILAGSLLFDIIGQLHRPTGHAVQGLPLSEYDRIPAPDEIVQVQVIANEMAVQARGAKVLLDPAPIRALEERLLAGGREFAGRLLRGLREAGIDLEDPLEFLLALKAVGPRAEALWGLGEPDPDVPGGRRPLVPADMFRAMLDARAQTAAAVEARGLRGCLAGRAVVLASADVHVYGKAVLRSAFEAAGARIVDLGASVEPEAIPRALQGEEAAAAAVSIYNAAALGYARRLCQAMARVGMSTPIFVGGRLNQDTGEALPVNVEGELVALGITPARDPVEVVERLGRGPVKKSALA